MQLGGEKVEVTVVPHQPAADGTEYVALRYRYQGRSAEIAIKKSTFETAEDQDELIERNWLKAKANMDSL
jgi:hypothetical protein